MRGSKAGMSYPAIGPMPGTAAFQQDPSTQGSQPKQQDSPPNLFTLRAEKSHNLTTKLIKGLNIFPRQHSQPSANPANPDLLQR
jgi:hypothetical protein